MEAWAIVAIVVAVLIFAALAFGLLKRFRGQWGGVKIDVEAAEPKRRTAPPKNSSVQIKGSDILDSTVRASGGADVGVDDSTVNKAKVIGEK